MLKNEKKLRFPKEFKLGVASSAYQIEGGYNLGGKSDSVWDYMTHTYSQIKGNGDIACDFYHRYKEDIKLMSDLGIKNYRMSLSWSRIMSEDSNRVNDEGIKFYNQVIDTCLEYKIEPHVTLFHFDTPMYLQEKGGWLSRKTIDAFEIYASVCFDAFGDRVKSWMTINEPYICANMYAYQAKMTGEKRPIDYALKAGHYLNLAHCIASKVYNEGKYNDGKIGIVPNLSIISKGERTSDVDQNFADCLYNRFYMEYAFKGDYPEEIKEFCEENKVDFDFRDEDYEYFANARTDFIGVNNYSRMVMGENIDFLSFSSETMALTAETNIKGAQYTDYGWEIYPKGIKDILIHISKLYDYPEVMITENGMAAKDLVIDEKGMVLDDDRIEFLELYMEKALEAIDEGVNLTAFFVWCFMDNFEWTSAYSIKMGLVKCDFDTLKRTPKKSAYWFKNLMEEQEI